MVVFMDQLTQQTPPVADKLPVIGQVNIACREVRGQELSFFSFLWHPY